LKIFCLLFLFTIGIAAGPATKDRALES